MNHNAKTVVVGVFIFFISVRSFTHSLANPRVALTHSPSAYARLVLALTSWSTLTTGGLRILKVRWKTFSIMPLRLTQSMDPTRTLSPTITLRLIFFSSTLHPWFPLEEHHFLAEWHAESPLHPAYKYAREGVEGHESRVNGPCFFSPQLLPCIVSFVHPFWARFVWQKVRRKLHRSFAPLYLFLIVGYMTSTSVAA